MLVFRETHTGKLKYCNECKKKDNWGEEKVAWTG